MTRRLFLAAPILLAACVAPQQAAPPPPPAPRPAPMPAPAPPPIAWQDRAYTPGDWSYRRSGVTSEAAFGAETPLVSLICEAGSGQVRLRVPGAVSGSVTVRTTDGDVARSAQASDGALLLALPARDPLLDRIAIAGGASCWRRGPWSWSCRPGPKSPA